MYNISDTSAGQDSSGQKREDNAWRSDRLAAAGNDREMPASDDALTAKLTCIVTILCVKLSTWISGQTHKKEREQ